MASAVSPPWQEKASEILQSSGVKLKEAGQNAGTFVNDVAKDAKVNVSDVAERVGKSFKSRWAVLQQPSTRQAMQERLISAAAATGTFLRRGLSETKDKVVVGKTKVEEVAKKTAQKSKTLLTDIERWQKQGVASTDVFGIPIEVTIRRQKSNTQIPSILTKCADYLILSGLNSEHLFKAQGDRKVIRYLVSAYNNKDPDYPLPEGLSAVDVAALMKCYITSLPEPLTTFELYPKIRNAHSSIPAMRSILKNLPSANYMTLELITALLLRVSERAVLNKMDARSLAVEMAPILMWREGRKPDCCYEEFWRSNPLNLDSRSNYKHSGMFLDAEEEEGGSCSIPLDDDGSAIDLVCVDVIQCLIQHHNAVFH
ncbi:hypothetical protein M569_04008 [Genlisea aurea]|uniref:Rho-GAP domain-containing protein n=1 Tax=Genlisea aurea TaxID=192259 RepID=S8EDU6_9LAMI|nr:hypothetical protein M569_04008 [Genlisea aurea]